MANPSRRIRSRRARLYESVRTAHLERAHELEPAAIVYQTTRYDFDPATATGLELIEAGPLAAARLVRDSDVEVVEINEPLMLSALPTTVLVLALARMRRRAVPTVVTYAIGNDDPFGVPSGSRMRTRVRRRIERLAARWVWRRVDRIVYGTPAARHVYADLLGPGPAAEELVLALPAPCPQNDEPPTADGRVMFLGAFTARKGIRHVLEAWPEVAARVPHAELVLSGKGPLEDEVRAAAAVDPRIRLVVDPPRALIHTLLAEARVLVLPSQPSATWREQVGLPIVEALAHGCSIVTTDETGLAEWLTEHGHAVLPGASGPGDVADAIIAQLVAGPDPHDVRRALPDVDGRIAADRWLMRDEHPTGVRG